MGNAIYKVKATALNLRGSPAAQAPVVAVMPRDSLVSAIEGPNAAGWLRVSWNAFTGYAAGQYLVPLSGGAAPLAANETSAKNLLERDRSLDKLHPVVRAGVMRLVTQLNLEGAPFKTFETFRTPERQADLYAQGRTKPGGIVTKAQPWSSFHQYGLAADLVLFVEGVWSWDDSPPRRAWWDRMKALAPTMGLVTLDFERPHVQIAGTSSGQLRQGNYPPGGDESWFDALGASIRRWRDSGRTPEAPPLVDDQRPPL